MEKLGDLKRLTNALSEKMDGAQDAFYIKGKIYTVDETFIGEIKWLLAALEVLQQAIKDLTAKESPALKQARDLGLLDKKIGDI